MNNWNKFEEKFEKIITENYEYNILLNRIFNLNAKLIIIHDFSYNNLSSKINNFLNDDKYHLIIVLMSGLMHEQD